MTHRAFGVAPWAVRQRLGPGGRRIAAAGLAGAWAVLGCAGATEASAAASAVASPVAAAGAAGRSLVTVIDNSQADSIIEVDRTADLQIGRGAAGSDHDGSTALVTGLLGAAPAVPEVEEGGGE
ncbi:hypothetical protein ACFVVL_26210 [Kitasatospora sp. NPDC058115]|uniref:hypothetical protein n=1 Tax=Kitasatospora sp. NPDC058115 TaxID=3346347 RepID=UPI0036DD9BFC